MNENWDSVIQAVHIISKINFRRILGYFLPNMQKKKKKKKKKKKHGCERLPVDKYNQPKIYQNLEKNTRKLKFRPEIPNTIPIHNSWEKSK